jgi:hypothetical protein
MTRAVAARHGAARRDGDRRRRPRPSGPPSRRGCAAQTACPTPARRASRPRFQPVGGGPARTERLSRVRRSPVDCFYVHPAVGSGSTPAAEREAQLRAVARWQASRFSQICRLWAPVQRPSGQIRVRRRTPRVAELPAHIQRRRGPSSCCRTGAAPSCCAGSCARRWTTGRPSVAGCSPPCWWAGTSPSGAAAATAATSPHRRLPLHATDGCVVAFSMYGDPPPADSRFGRASPGPRPPAGPVHESRLAPRRQLARCAATCARTRRPLSSAPRR